MILTPLSQIFSCSATKFPFTFVPEYNEKETTKSSKLNEYLENPEKKLCLLSGPSHLGKRTLIREIFPAKKRVPLFLDPDDIPTLFKTLGQQIEQEFEELGFKLQQNYLEVEFFLSHWKKPSKKKMFEAFERACNRAKGSDYASKFIIKILKNCPFVPVFQEIHRLDPKTLAQLTQQIPLFLENSIPLCLTGYYSEKDLVNIENQFQDKIVPIPFQLWPSENLLKIATQGLEALKIKLSPLEIVSRIAQDSFGSPQIIHEIFLKILTQQNITHSQSQEKEISISTEELKTIYLEIAFEHGDTYKKMVEKVKRGVRKPTSPYHTDALIIEYLFQNPKLLYSKEEILSAIDRSPAVIEEALARFDSFFQLPETQHSLLSYKQDTLSLKDPILLFYLKNFLTSLKT